MVRKLKRIGNLRGLLEAHERSRNRRKGKEGGQEKKTHFFDSDCENAVQLFHLRQKSNDIQLGKVANSGVYTLQHTHTYTHTQSRNERTEQHTKKLSIFLGFALTISTNVKYAILFLFRVYFIQWPHYFCYRSQIQYTLACLPLYVCTNKRGKTMWSTVCP